MTATAAHLFQCVDPEADEYPRPCLPILPYITLSQLAFRPRQLPYALTRPHLFFKNARTALAQILARNDCSRGPVLVPGYICKSVIEPLIWSRLKFEFYRLNDDLSVDVTDFLAKVTTASAAIVTHFFGIPQRAVELRKLCDENGCILIEDCAHALMGNLDGHPLGSFGHYSIASTVKFTPGIDGGLLVDNTRDAVITPAGFARSQSGMLHSAAVLLQRSLEAHGLRFTLPRLDGLPNVPSAPAWRSQRMHAVDRSPDASGHYEWFNPEDLQRRGDSASYRLLYHLNYAFIAARRRANFQHYLDRLVDSPARPLLTALPAGMVPYMFPASIADPERHFRVLKHLGVPICRWEQQHLRAPELGTHYGSRLLHLPCHQCIGEREIDIICQRLLHGLR